MEETKLTPWFDGNRHRPVRPGVYMLMCGGTGKQAGYQLWDGKQWGPWYPDVERAAATPPGKRADLWRQNDNWRGLRRKPRNAERSS